MTQTFNNIFTKGAKLKKYLLITLDLHDFLIVPFKQLNDKLIGAIGM